MCRFSRRVEPSFFNRFISLILVLTLFIFLNLNFSKKEVKAIEPVTTLTFATYLLVGGLATMCGVKFASMPKESRYDFISGGFEAIKDVANWGVDGQGLATKLILNEATIKAFLEYVQNKEGSSILSEGKCDVIDGYYRVPFSVVQNDSKAWLKSSHISLNDNFSNSDTWRFYVYDSNGSYVNSLLNPFPKSFYIATRHFYSDMSEFCFLGDDGSICGTPSIPKTLSILYLYVPENLVDNVSVLDKTVVYPKNLTDVRGIEDYTKQWDKTVGQQSIEVDGAKTGVDVSTPIEGSNSLTDDIVFPAGIEEGVEVPGLKINAGEGSIEASPDTSKDDTLEHKGILQDILDWLGSLVLSLMDFLLNLLDKLIDMLKSLLISLFVPSVSLAETKELIMERLSLPIFSAPVENLNKEPFTFTFPIGSFNGVNNSDIVITLNQPWFSVIRELILGYICYLAVLFAYKKISSLHNG